MVKRHTRPRSVKDTQKAAVEWHHREGGADRRLQRDAARPHRQQADPGRRAGDRRRQARSGTRSAPARRSSRPGWKQRQPQTRRSRRRHRGSASATRARSSAALTEKFGYSSRMQVPRLEKITLNMGVGEAKTATPILEAATEQLATIAGQQPNVRRARKSIANFKLRDGMPVGVAVTLRGARMWEFLDRLVTIAIPRIRDFRGSQPPLLRRSRQLLPGDPRAADLPGDRLRLDRRGPRPRRRDHDHRADRRGGVRAPARRSACPSPDGRPGTTEPEAAEEEERRHEEARLRAEAEQAALEQLKEENPEAYAKRERPVEGEEGEEAGEGGERGVLGDKGSERGMKWRRRHSESPSGASPSTRPATYNRCRRCGRPRAYYRKFGLCRLCLREAAHQGYVPGMTKSSW